MELSAVIYPCILLTILVHSVLGDNTVTVSSNSGPIRGVAVNEKNETVYQFRKIPYAKPPLGQLRFKKPEPFGTWNVTLDATKFGPSCMQNIDQGTVPDLPNTNISEDCLFLNIYVPRNISATNNMTVMVWIHGGSFLFGQGMLYDGSFLALSGDVIVVTINYRLNIFGFLSTGDSTSLGNYGLWDQLEAIRWVRSNIYAFGGNPSSITIFGESAGSLSIGLHVLYPNNDDLFQRAIMESGSGNSFISYTANGPSAAKLAGELLSCDTNSSSIMVDCLRNQSADALLDTLEKGLNVSFDPKRPIIGLVLGPVIDGDFVKSDPIILISNKTSESYRSFRSKDIMSGTMNGEGSLLLSFLKPYQSIFNFSLTSGIPKSVLCDHVAPVLVSDFYKGNSKISDAICKKYSVPNSDIAEQGRQIVSMYGDVMFVSPSVKTLQIHSQENKQSKSYMFHFTHQFSKAYGSPYPAWFKFASHATELAYLFAIPKYNTSFTISEKDIKLSENMLEYWTSFAKYGNPNGKSLPNWPEFQNGSSYLDLDLNITAKNNLYSDRMNFWLKTIPGMAHQQVPSSTPALPASTTNVYSTTRMSKRTKRTTSIKTTNRNKGTTSKGISTTMTNNSTKMTSARILTTTPHNTATTLFKAPFVITSMLWVAFLTRI